MPTGQWTRMIGGSKLYQPANFSLRGPDTGGWAGYYQERHSGTWTEEYNGWFAWKLDSSMNIPADLEVDVWIGPDSKIELQWDGSNDLELQLMEWEWLPFRNTKEILRALRWLHTGRNTPGPAHRRRNHSLLERRES